MACAREVVGEEEEERREVGEGEGGEDSLHH